MIRVTHVFTVADSLLFLTDQPAYMRARGIELAVIASPSPALRAFGERNGVETFEVPMARRITPLRDLVALRELVAYLRRTRPDIVHGHTPKGGLLAMCAATLARVPVRVYHMRGLPLMGRDGWKRRLLIATERVSCGLSTETLCVSHSLRRVAIDLRLASPAKLRVLLGGSGQGVDAEHRFDPSRVTTASRAVYGLAEDAVVFGFVGRVVRDKGVEELAAAWSRVRDRIPNARLLIVGSPEPEDPVSGRAMQALRADPRVVLHGATSDTPGMYALMDVVVLPTYREGFPNVPLEAAAMGLPVIATRVPGCVDAVLDGATGILVPPRDSGALADAMIAYGTDTETRSAHGRAGRRRVLAEFQRSRIIEALADRYEQLLVEARVGGTVASLMHAVRRVTSPLAGHETSRG